MKHSIHRKLEQVSERFEEITGLLAEPQVQSDQNQFRSLSQEYAQIEPLVDCYRDFLQTEQEIAEAEEMLTDPEMAALAEESLNQARQQQNWDLADQIREELILRGVTVRDRKKI